MVYKAKLTSKGYLDKLKGRCVVRGDLQRKLEAEETWSPCIFARTFKVFVAMAAKHNRAIKQLDFVGAFCQGTMRHRMFIQLPREYKKYFPEWSEYFDEPVMLIKSMYGTTIAARTSWSDDLLDWLDK